MQMANPISFETIFLDLKGLSPYIISSQGTFRASSFFSVYRANREIWSTHAPLIEEHIEVLPIGWAESQNQMSVSRKKDSDNRNNFGTRTVRYFKPQDRMLALVCLFLNHHPESKQCSFGIITLPQSQDAGLPTIANVINGDKRFVFKVGSLPAQIDPQIFFNSHEQELLALWTPCHIDKLAQLAFGVSGAKPQNQGIFLALDARPPTLTREEHIALGSFLFYYLTAFEQLCFNVLIRPTDDMQSTMKCLAQIKDIVIKNWIDQFITEMLVHPVPEVRNVAKSYFDALPKGVSHV
jgi:hypothetical protein